MTNREKYDDIFMKHFHKTKEELPSLKYRGIREWDSLAHMDLMSIFEETFDIMLETIDILAFSSYTKGIEILQKYGVDI